MLHTDSPATSIFISLKSESSRSCAEFMPNKLKGIEKQSWEEKNKSRRMKGFPRECMITLTDVCFISSLYTSIGRRPEHGTRLWILAVGWWATRRPRSLTVTGWQGPSAQGFVPKLGWVLLRTLGSWMSASSVFQAFSQHHTSDF
jgi:hypothetical protein